MPRAPKKCGKYGCEQRVVGRPWCDVHTAEQQRRAPTVARGYDHHHRRTRAEWEPLVAAGGVRCWRCGETIQPDEAWDLGHDDHDRTIHRGPEHARRCNRATAPRRAIQRRTPVGNPSPRP